MKTIISKLKDKKVMNLLFIFTAVVYALVLTRASLFKYVRPWELFADHRVYYLGFNLIPFNGSGFDFIRDLVINFFLYAPLGFLVSMKTVMKKAAWLYTLIPLLVSIMFEMLQYIMSLGAADVTDIIMNSLGGVMGFLFYYLTLKLFKNKDNLNFVYSIIMTIVGLIALLLMY